MAFYGQKNYYDKMGGGNGGLPAKYAIAQVGCFVTAFCNLLQRFGKDVDPPSLNRLFTQRAIYVDIDDGIKDDLGFQSITAYDGQVHTINVNYNAQGSWPSNPNAIVKFAYKSPKTGLDTTHFCLVADPSAHTIVDSWDGVVRTPGYYGNPVSWAEYDSVIPQQVIVPAQAPQMQSKATDGSIYKMQRGDTIWSVAMLKGYSPQELMEHNGIDPSQVRNIPIGYEMHLPIRKIPAPQTSGYKIELLPEGKVYHVSRPGGAEKWAFGNIRSWGDFKTTQHVPENTNVNIVAVATVQVGSETAAYYMDTTAVGDYKTRGMVANTVGFNWKDLAEGAAPQAAVQPPAPTIAPDPPAAPATPTPVIPAPPVTPQTQAPNEYKATYKAFPQPKLYIFTPPKGVNDMMIHEFDSRRPDHQILRNQAVSLAGTFIYGQDLYGRPSGAVKAGYWFGVPMDYLTSEDELYSTQVNLPEKIMLGKALNITEHIAVSLSWLRNALKK